MRKHRSVETRGDRVALLQDAGMRRVSLGSVLAGTLVAYGAFAVLIAVAAAIAKGVGFDTDLTTDEWRRLGTAGGALVALVLLLSYFSGGYVAGRMARRAGSLHGFLVVAAGIAVAVGVAGLVGVFTDGSTIVEDLRGTGVPTTAEEWGDVATVAGIGSLAAMFVGSILGGMAGERWHAKLISRAVDPAIGPEAEAEKAARRRHDEAVERAERTGTFVPGATGTLDRSAVAPARPAPARHVDAENTY
ncbi:MAG: hypothetical protein ACRDZW_04665 [Acidimicrobiales bacterium]